MKTKTVFFGSDRLLCNWLSNESEIIRPAFFSNPITAINYLNENKDVRVVIYYAEDTLNTACKFTRFLKEHIERDNVIIIVFYEGTKYLTEFLRSGADDVFDPTVNIKDFDRRIVFLKKHKTGLLELERPKREALPVYQIPVWKRVFDILFASVAIILLLPLFLLIAVAIKLESKGKVFYASKRVGTGYRIFNFYKFRSMYQDADKRVDLLENKNQYFQNTVELINEDAAITDPKDYSTILFYDNEMVQEAKFLVNKRVRQHSTFFKISNDPRITRVGRFIRNTSIDELPQLFNVLKGDMSIVGNRPLPLYEAELLTTDDWAKRFMAPAGLTGLWQVTKRAGSVAMSADDRKKLDIEYADNYSFWGDMGIIAKTFPAMLQHENV